MNLNQAFSGIKPDAEEECTICGPLFHTSTIIGSSCLFSFSLQVMLNSVLFLGGMYMVKMLLLGMYMVKMLFVGIHYLVEKVCCRECQH